MLLLYYTRRNDLLRTKCPTGSVKRCGGRNVYRWVYSGRKVSYTQWNRATGEPHGPPEYCATLWTKAGFNWGDWGCNLRVI